MTTTNEPSDSVLRCLDRALKVMNEAIVTTAEQGPEKGMEMIADYLNDSDGIDEELAESCPEDWLTRWVVSRDYNSMQTNYTGPDPSVECEYPPCRNRLLLHLGLGPQWCSGNHREATRRLRDSG